MFGAFLPGILLWLLGEYHLFLLNDLAALARGCRFVGFLFYLFPVFFVGIIVRIIYWSCRKWVWDMRRMCFHDILLKIGLAKLITGLGDLSIL